MSGAGRKAGIRTRVWVCLVYIWWELVLKYDWIARTSSGCARVVKLSSHNFVANSWLGTYVRLMNSRFNILLLPFTIDPNGMLGPMERNRDRRNISNFQTLIIMGRTRRLCLLPTCVGQSMHGAADVRMSNQIGACIFSNRVLQRVFAH
eukprot:scaffold28376_cov54-Attheya_sp.AAC.4